MDNLEDYYYFSVREMYTDYIKYVRENDDVDPDYPKLKLTFEDK